MLSFLFFGGGSGSGAFVKRAPITTQIFNYYTKLYIQILQLEKEEEGERNTNS